MIRAILVATLLFGTISNCLASEPPTAEERLQILYKEIEEQDITLTKVANSQKILKKEITKLSTEYNRLGAEETKLKNALAESFTAWQASNKRISELDINMREVKARSLKRLRALYMGQNGQAKTHLVSLGRHDNVSELLYLLGKVEGFDRTLITQLKNLHEEQQREEARYASLMKEQQELKAKVIKKSEEIKKTVDKKNKASRDLDRRQKELEALLVKLRSNALRLETVVASLTQADEAAEDNESRKSKEEEIVINRGPREPFKGAGLEVGKVTNPVNGRVIRAFGKYRHAEFRDIIFNNGILYLAPVNAPIKAVAKGQVVYVGRMPGYGSMVIIDHGERNHTLYARLSSSRVQTRQLVDAGEVIALTEEVGSDHGNFYFEVRQAGKPVNPQRYFKNP